MHIPGNKMNSDVKLDFTAFYYEKPASKDQIHVFLSGALFETEFGTSPSPRFLQLSLSMSPLRTLLE
jgi:hypothetical protein